MRYDLGARVNTVTLDGLFTEWISVEKVKEALRAFDSKKSPGPDGLKPILFKHLPPNFVDLITLIYKACINLQYTPKHWKESKVVFIPKPGKSDYTDPKAFRPISLSNYLLKGLERLANWRMEVALAMNPVHDKQHGFRPDRSTETAISSTVSYIQQHLFKRQHCLGVFLDLSLIHI